MRLCALADVHPWDRYQMADLLTKIKMRRRAMRENAILFGAVIAAILSGDTKKIGEILDAE